MLNAAARSPEVSIHVAGARDVNVFLAIERSVFSGDRISRAEYERLTESSDYFVLIGHYFRSAAGAMVIKQSRDASEAYLYSLAVVPEFRRFGIGSALMRAAFALASSWAVSRVALEVREDNFSAIRFYEKAGFAKTGKKSTWYEDGSAALCMTRAVPHASAPAEYFRKACT